MSNPIDDNELKALAGLYALLTYALRELRELDATCKGAEDGVCAAQAALRARMSTSDLNCLDGDDDAKALVK